MRVREIRPGVFSAELTAHELSTLIAGARMSLGLMESDERIPGEARDSLRAVLENFDAALAQTRRGEDR